MQIKKSSYLYLVTTLLILVNMSPTISYAQPVAKTFTLRGPSGCTNWVNKRALAKLAQNDPKSVMDGYGSNFAEFWLLGLLTGLNASAFIDENPLGKIDAETAYDWMDNYCKINPKSDLYEGGVLLLTQVAKIK